MAKCIISGGIMVCNGSPRYRVNGGGWHRFPKLTRLSAGRRKAIREVHKTIKVLGNGDQETLAKDLFDIVMAAYWNGHQSANARDIKDSVQLMLVNRVPSLRAGFLLTSG